MLVKDYLRYFHFLKLQFEEPKDNRYVDSKRNQHAQQYMTHLHEFFCESLTILGREQPVRGSNRG